MLVDRVRLAMHRCYNAIGVRHDTYSVVYSRVTDCMREQREHGETQRLVEGNLQNLGSCHRCTNSSNDHTTAPQSQRQREQYNLSGTLISLSLSLSLPVSLSLSRIVHTQRSNA
jgi:hypothetical protein